MNGRNVAASVRARLLNLARATGQDFNFILIRYALERLLYRLSISAYADFLAFEKTCNELKAFIHRFTLLPRHLGAPKCLNCVTYVSGIKCYPSVG